MKKIWPFVLVVLLLLTACSSANNNQGRDQNNNVDESPSDRTYEPFVLDLRSGPANLNELKMSLSNLEGFFGVFTLSFEGHEDWLYQVEIRYDGKLVEYNLHIEGVDPSLNPGDIRLVNTNGINRMIGPGTDNTCVQFPDDMNTGALFLWPVDVINPDVLINDWTIQEGRTFLDRQTTSYTTEQDFYYGWEDIEVSFLLDSASGAILIYVFDALGMDPLYNFGGGEIHGEFTVMEVGPQNIAPVEGCEIPIPVPEDAYNIIILPGVYAYKSWIGPVRTDQFFSELLEPMGWTRETAQVNDETREGFLVYSSATQTLTVHIQALDPNNFSEGYQIRLYLEDK